MKNKEELVVESRINKKNKRKEIVVIFKGWHIFFSLVDGHVEKVFSLHEDISMNREMCQNGGAMPPDDILNATKSAAEKLLLPKEQLKEIGLKKKKDKRKKDKREKFVDPSRG